MSSPPPLVRTTSSSSFSFPRSIPIMSSDARSTRSMKRRRSASPEVPSGSEKLFSPLCFAPKANVPSSSLTLDGLPSEIGILISDCLDTASQASLALVNRTTASWVSKSLLARVTACQTDEVAEALNADDAPETVARFITAVTSVCIPEWEKIRFVGGIVQLHCRPDSAVPTLGIVDECKVLRAVVGGWSAERQGELLAQYLATELKTLKPISHFLKLPGDSGSNCQATDERIFRVLNYVMVLNAGNEKRVEDNTACSCVSCGGNGDAAAGENRQVAQQVADAKWRHLATVVLAMTRTMPSGDQETHATLIHLMLGPNEFYLRLVTGESLAPVTTETDGDAGDAAAVAPVAPPFFCTFDLTDDTASDYAEDCEYSGFDEHFESFDVSLQAFANLFSHMLGGNTSGDREADQTTFLLIALTTKCWSFEYKLALLAFITRRTEGTPQTRTRVFALKKKIMHALLDTAALAEHCAPSAASGSKALPVALFRVLVRGSYAADDFAVFFRELSKHWSGAAQRVVLAKVMHGLVKGDILTEGCDCGCLPVTVNAAVFDKVARLAIIGVLPLNPRGFELGNMDPTAESQSEVEFLTPCDRDDDEYVDDDKESKSPFFDGLCSPCVPAKRGATQTRNTPQPGTPFGVEE